MMMFVCVGIAAAYMTACDKNDDCSLDLTGNCMIEELSLDNYEGTIDLATRSIVVRLPEGHDASRMTVTSLKISDGAKADIAQGQVLNMESAHRPSASAWATSIWTGTSASCTTRRRFCRSW